MPMQPRPCTPTPGPPVPSSTVSIFLLPMETSEPLGRPPGVGVDVDLVVEYVQRALQLRYPLPYVLAVRGQQLLTLGEGGLALPHHLGVADHVRDRHSGQPQLGDQAQPVQ